MKDEKQQDPETRARSLALRLLARREHSRQELSLKLRQRKIETDVIDTVLDEYEAEGWLDDQRFAEVFTRQRMDMSYGPLRILAELQQRGVHQSPDCLNEVPDECWCELAARLRERRFGLAPVHDDLPEKMRQARFLARRGFTSSQVEKALGVTDLEGL